MQTEPGLVAFYDIRPRNGAGLFLKPCSPHGAHEDYLHAPLMYAYHISVSDVTVEK